MFRKERCSQRKQDNQKSETEKVDFYQKENSLTSDRPELLLKKKVYYPQILIFSQQLTNEGKMKKKTQTSKIRRNTSLIQNIAFDQGFCSTKGKSSWGNMHIYAFV